MVLFNFSADGPINNHEANCDTSSSWVPNNRVCGAFGYSWKMMMP